MRQTTDDQTRAIGRVAALKRHVGLTLRGIQHGFDRRAPPQHTRVRLLEIDAIRVMHHEAIFASGDRKAILHINRKQDGAIRRGAKTIARGARRLLDARAPTNALHDRPSQAIILIAGQKTRPACRKGERN